MKIEKLTVGQMSENCYIVIDEKTSECVIIDPGDDADYLSSMLTKWQVTPVAIIATHGHFDHIMAACALELMYVIPFLLHTEDSFLLGNMASSAKHFLGIRAVDPPPTLTRSLKDGDTIAVGNHMLTVIHTPGHTPGSICLWDKEDNVVFVGDTIFAEGGVGRTDFSYSSPLSLAQSLKNILSMDEDISLLPGHGEETTVGRERAHRVHS